MQARIIGRILLFLSAVVSAGGAHAAVLVTTQLHPTSGLPGHTTAILTVTSSDPLQPILGFDFSGHPDNNDSATGFGFFGPMNQVNPLGASTVFSTDWTALDPSLQVQDSHFLVNDMAVTAGGDNFQEGASILQGVWAFGDPQRLSVPFAHLVIPNSTPATVIYRGQVLVGESGNGVLINLIGTISVPEPCSLLMAVGATLAFVGAGGRQSR